MASEETPFPPTAIFGLLSNQSPAYNQGAGTDNLTGQHDMPVATSLSLGLQILKVVYLVSVPLVCLTGMIGNFLALFVFVSKPLRRTSCSWYLGARSISDGGFLFSTFLTWASDYSHAKFFHTEGLCQVIIFMTFVFAFLSVWLTVIVTLENYIRICRPFSVQKFCSVSIAQRTILALWLAGLLLYHYPFWTNKVYHVTGQDNSTIPWCTGISRYSVGLKWLSLVDMLITLVIPSMVIIILMIAITLSLIKSLQRQTRLQSGTSSSRNGQTLNNTRSSRSSSSPQAKVTRMLFAVSFFFILLNGPSHIIRTKMAVMEMIYGSSNSALPTVEEQLQFIFQIIYLLSFAVNLVIYLTCGGNFRKQFKETYLFCCPNQLSAQRGCSEMTAMSVVRLEEVELQRHEDQAALLENGTPPVSNKAGADQPS